MEGTTEKTGTALVIIGYKYNKKKVLTFVTTRGAGSTEKGEPYEARFPDKYGNLCVRHVARPDCVSNFFKYSNKVDLHNKSRQFDLALEKNGSLRILTFAYSQRRWEHQSLMPGKCLKIIIEKVANPLRLQSLQI